MNMNVMKIATGAGKPQGKRPLLSRVDAVRHGGFLIRWPNVAHGIRGFRTMGITRTMRWMLAAAAVLALRTQTLPQKASDPNTIDVVVLDAGHGGKDPGNLGTGRYKTTEKNVCLAVTKLVGKYINKNFPDVKVIYTREDDRFIELKDRTEIANKANADLFISIHCNANEKPDPIGTATYVMGLHKTEANMRTAMRENSVILMEDDHALKYGGFDPKDPDSQIYLSLRQNAYLDHSLTLASGIQSQFNDRVGRVDRGVEQAGFWVISFTTMPSVLIELGFTTNPKEEDFLIGDKGQDLMASAIYRAFKDYKQQIEGTDVKINTHEEPDRGKVDSLRRAQGDINKKDSGVRFKVQIVTSSKRIDTKPKNFNGMMGVEELKGNDLWKYSVGSVNTLDSARAVQQRCRDKGFDGCFIVAFKNGERIDLQQAVILTRDH